MKKTHYSCSELAALKLPGYPATRQGWDSLIKGEGWPYIESKSRGRIGVTREYEVPAQILQLIRSDRPQEVVSHYSVQEPSKAYETKKIRHYVNVRGSAGPGYSIEDETVIEVSVDTQLLRERFGTNFANIQIVGVRGDSMEPTLSHGDQVAVDTSCDRFIDDAIYAIQQNGDLRFKRIRLHLDGSIEVISDNERFQNINRPEIYKPEQLSGVHIIGRVIPLKFGLFKV